MTRYARQELLLGKELQRKLCQSTAAVIGLGGTGSMAAELLARSGVNLILFEPDKVAETNLHRQVLYEEGDIGKSKTRIASARLKKINSDINVKSFSKKFGETDKNKIKSCNVALDCTDDWISRYVINIVCTELKLPWVYSAAIRQEGMLMPFSGKGKPCFKCVFPDEGKQCGLEKCSDVGVLGTVPSIIGALAANEALKIIMGKAEYGKLYHYKFDNNKRDVMNVSMNKECEVCGN